MTCFFDIKTKTLVTKHSFLKDHFFIKYFLSNTVIFDKYLTYLTKLPGIWQIWWYLITKRCISSANNSLFVIKYHQICQIRTWKFCQIFEIFVKYHCFWQKLFDEEMILKFRLIGFFREQVKNIEFSKIVEFRRPWVYLKMRPKKLKAKSSMTNNCEFFQREHHWSNSPVVGRTREGLPGTECTGKSHRSPTSNSSRQKCRYPRLTMKKHIFILWESFIMDLNPK